VIRKRRVGPPGAVTGRFQPLHCSHLELLLHGLDRHKTVWVGITNPDPGTHVADAAHPQRHLAGENPFTYVERLRFVVAALSEAGIPRDRYEVVAFPLHSPYLNTYLPREAVQYVRCFSPWERRKADLLAERGYQVEVIDGGERKRHAAGRTRAAIREGRPWRHHVPPSVAALLDEFLKARSLEERA
jgi:nicotinamide mononucleotide adenylyltransferase